MVAGAGDQLVATHEVQPRVPTVSPVGHVALQDACDQGGARVVDQALLTGVTQQLMVACHDGVLQEAQRVGQHRLGIALEHRGHGLQGQL